MHWSSQYLKELRKRRKRKRKKKKERKEKLVRRKIDKERENIRSGSEEDGYTDMS